ncbi:MAG: four-carbon acid sugar kinase family protein [Bacillota bacterium]
MAPRLAVIADDLTGAMDTALQFGKAGHRTVVSLTGMGPLHDCVVDVIVVSTDSREISPSAAYKAVWSATREMAASGILRFYKKVDSTLRGHVATDLDAMLDALGYSRALFCPSFPESGRILVGGYHLVHQVPLQRTELTSDPGARFKTSYVPGFLQENSRRPVGHISLGTVMAGSDEILAAMGAAFASRQQILVADAATREDLSAVAHAADLFGEPLLLAGSAGLAEEVAARLERVGDPPVFLGSSGPSRSDRPVLFVSGSTTEVNREQVGYLLAQGEVAVIAGNAAALLSGDVGEQSRVMEAVVASLRSGRDTLVLSAPDSEAVRAGLTAGDLMGYTPQETRRVLAGALAVLVARILGQVRVAGLTVTGGEVSSQVLHALGASQIELVGEVQAGVPLGRVLRPGLPPLALVTKSGSLGQVDAFHVAGMMLKQLDSEVTDP